METRIIQLLENQPSKKVKTSELQFSNFSVNAGTNIFSTAIDTENVSSMTVCGFQNLSSPDGTCILELWPGDANNSSSFLSPQATSQFSSALLFCGSIPVDSRFMKLRLINNHTETSTFTIRYYTSS